MKKMILSELSQLNIQQIKNFKTLQAQKLSKPNGILTTNVFYQF